jgi:hypothetical protein
MAIGTYEQFSAIDWAHYANLSGQIASASCVGFALLSLVFGLSNTLFHHFGGFLWTISCGLIIAIWEIPPFYSSIPNCNKLRNTAQDELYIRVPHVRAGLYAFFAVFILISGHIYVIPGIILLASAILYGFTGLNAHTERANHGRLGNDETNPLSGYIVV